MPTGTKKTMVPMYPCIVMFIAALLTIPQTWKQPKCAWRDAWVKKMWYIHTMEYYSAIKMNKIIWMNLH